MAVGKSTARHFLIRSRLQVNTAVTITSRNMDGVVPATLRSFLRQAL